MESLTGYQASRIRVAVRTVRKDTAGPGMESLTGCQANRTRVAVRTVGTQLNLAWNHSLPVKPTEPEHQ